MGYRLWCGVVVAAAAVLTVQGGAVREARQARQCSAGNACVSLRLCRPLQDIIGRREPGYEQTVRNAMCGRNGRDIKVCCPEAGGGSSTGPVIGGPSPVSVSGEALLPSGSGCGQSSDTRVVNGDDAPLYAYPWMALLGYNNAANPDWLCGGSLINDRYVLTAAHCVDKNYTRQNGVGDLVTIRMGEHNTATDPDCPASTFVTLPCAPSPQDFTAEEVIVHQTFNKRVLVSDDIALIRLNKKVTMANSVRPVCVPPADLDVPRFLGSRDALVAGWGATERGRSSDILQVARVPFANRTTCDAQYPNLIVDEQVCFGGRGNVDSCTGDSGGPIFQTDSLLPRHTVLGLVSYGKGGCGRPGVPAVYTNVAKYRKWITDNLKP